MSRNRRRLLNNMLLLAVFAGGLWALQWGLDWVGAHPEIVGRHVPPNIRLALLCVAVVGAAVWLLAALSRRLRRMTPEFVKSHLDNDFLMGEPLLSDDRLTAYYAMAEREPLSRASRKKQTFTLGPGKDGVPLFKVCHIARRSGRRLVPFRYRASYLHCDLQIVFRMEGDLTPLAEAIEKLPIPEVIQQGILLPLGDLNADLRKEYAPKATGYLSEVFMPWLKSKTFPRPAIAMPPEGLSFGGVIVLVHARPGRTFWFFVDIGGDAEAISNRLLEMQFKLPNVRYVAARL